MTLLQNGRRYFDWNASSLLCDRSRNSLISNLDLIGNASSVHSEGRKARNIIERSRDDIMDLLGLNEGTIIFTSGASESAALLLHNKKMQCSAIEHDCVKKWCDVSIPVTKNGLVSLNESKKNFKLEIKFINHACLIIKTDFIKFAIDPWVLGPAFLGGWWLKKRSPFSSFEELNECDFIYISHNHPDNLHDLTLQKIDSKITYIFPNFKNKSVENYLRALGKKKLIGIDFGFEYYFKDKIN